MSTFTFQRAEKAKAKLRAAILGPTGGGKTFTALAITQGRRVAVIDSEHGSAAKYADRFAFDALNLPDLDPRTYIKAIHAAEAAGYDVIIIDSLTHAWKATQELVDQETIRSRSANSFQAWGKISPIWQDLLQAMVTSKCHIIATIRSKIEWVLEEDSRGKKVPRKIGTKPEARDGTEYEFDVVLEIDSDHNAWTTKTRCPELDGKTWKNPSAADFGAVVFGWLESGTAEPVSQPAQAAATTVTKAATASERPIQATTSPKPMTPEQEAEYRDLWKQIGTFGAEAKAKRAELHAAHAAGPVCDYLDALRGYLEIMCTPSQSAR